MREHLSLMQHTWPFPRFADPLRAYVDLSDLVRLWCPRGRSSIQVCEFCRTALSSKARCHVCGTVHMSTSETTPAFEAAKDAAAVKDKAIPLAPIARAMARMLILPMLLFASFFLWYASHDSAANYTAPIIPSPVETIAAEAGVRTQTAPAAEFGEAPVLPEIGSADTAGDSRIAAALPKPRALRRTTVPRRLDATNANQHCAGQNVLMQAVCVNNACAEPDQARLPQCAQAIAQRRIDEERRNPVLMN